ncbi:hypothetical protein M9Y10_028164 [Tritrichomonas musculus]|uniref:CCZ1/INTU/HSP4 first Longin domain-containing protein n=1 Tax=Tritrichomonas musculus TaxID=1915356 RepID=A0ABR2KIH6_9EUKA
MKNLKLFDQESQITNLEYFIIFDGNVSEKEGAEPVIFYSINLNEFFNRNGKSDNSTNNANSIYNRPFFLVNYVGLLLTFIKFSRHFTQDIPCNYVRTDNHETSLLELDDQIWMSAQRQSSLSDPSNREILHSILCLCRNIYKLFFNPPKRDPTTNLVTPRSIKRMQMGFDMIVKSIACADLSFVHLFDSFFQLKLENKFLYLINQSVQQLKAKFPIAHIAILYSRYFIFSTFPVDIARTLSICLRMKLPYLFPRVLAKDDELLYWIIGLSKTERNTLALYSPPLFIYGKEYPLLALREKKLRFIITLQNTVCPSLTLLDRIPASLTPLRQLFRRVKLETKNGRKNGPYIVLENQSIQKFLFLTHEKLSDPFIPIAEKKIIQAHLFASNFSPLVTIVFPGAGYYIYFRRRGNDESLVICLNESKEVTQALKNSSELLIPENVKRPQIISK